MFVNGNVRDTSPKCQTAKTILKGAGYTTAALIAISLLIAGGTVMGLGIHQAAPFSVQNPQFTLLPMPTTELSGLMKIAGGGILISSGLVLGGTLVNHLLKKGEGYRARFFKVLDRNFVLQLLKSIALGGMIIGGVAMIAPSLYYLFYTCRDIYTVASQAIGCHTWNTGAWRAIAGVSGGSVLVSLGGLGIAKTFLEALWNQSHNKTNTRVLDPFREYYENENNVL